MDLDIQRNLAHLGAYDMLQELKAMFSKQAEQELMQTTWSDSVQPVVKILHVSNLSPLSSTRNLTSFVHNFNMHAWGRTVNELHWPCLSCMKESLPKERANPHFKQYEQERVQKNQKNKPHKAVPFAPKPKTPPPPKKDNPAKDAICHQCGEVGHWRRNCPVYLTELMKKKKLPQGASASGIFTIELYSFPSKSWIYDTGCGTHYLYNNSGSTGKKEA
ncbi:zinc finger, CCHC-type containing protein [Tanacetum coccineum]|uniref:Zinc finger, CCHC-type containing protein n=1 Tax=Tanacetum coccineum TaxID=301880 RepID=A0ABQ4WT29_9ASTR